MLIRLRTLTRIEIRVIIPLYIVRNLCKKDFLTITYIYNEDGE